MKITERVEDYVISAVRKKYSSYTQKEEEAYEAVKRPVFDFMKEKVKEMNDELDDRFPFLKNATITNKPSICYTLFEIDCPEYRALRKRENEVHTMRNEKEYEIIACLEMGGTFDDVQRLLEKD